RYGDARPFEARAGGRRLFPSHQRQDGEGRVLVQRFRQGLRQPGVEGAAGGGCRREPSSCSSSCICTCSSSGAAAALTWNGQCLAALPCFASAIALALVGHTPSALAQSAVGEAARRALQFESQQSEQQRLRQLQEQQRANRAPGGELPTPPTPTASAKGER